ncbi:hypothetical protein WJX73_003181 [Symbiochloris irregularis]|uniref:Uncharacterized protein n=1 Tax=Symbiochloris irregularis TaxID=706552 RepID=A0AAW1PIY6_9CHLO
MGAADRAGGGLEELILTGEVIATSWHDEKHVGTIYVPLRPHMQPATGPCTFAIHAPGHCEASPNSIAPKIGSVQLTVAVQDLGPTTAAQSPLAEGGLTMDTRLPQHIAAPAGPACLPPGQMSEAADTPCEGMVFPAQAHGQVHAPERGTPGADDVSACSRKQQARDKLAMRTQYRRRMEVLQREWHMREQKRTTEIARLQSQLTAQCTRAREVLVKAEERERRVAAVEAAQQARQQAMEATHAHCIADAQATLRRLQEDCSHAIAQAHTQSEASQQGEASAAAKQAAAEEAAKELKDQLRSTQTELKKARAQVQKLQEQQQQPEGPCKPRPAAAKSKRVHQQSLTRHVRQAKAEQVRPVTVNA